MDFLSRIFTSNSSYYGSTQEETILVTGATSFVGSHVIKAISEASNSGVTVTADSNTKSSGTSVKYKIRAATTREINRNKQIVNLNTTREINRKVIDKQIVNLNLINSQPESVTQSSSEDSSSATTISLSNEEAAKIFLKEKVVKEGTHLEFYDDLDPYFSSDSDWDKALDGVTTVVHCDFFPNYFYYHSSNASESDSGVSVKKSCQDKKETSKESDASSDQNDSTKSDSESSPTGTVASDDSKDSNETVTIAEPDSLNDNLSNYNSDTLSLDLSTDSKLYDAVTHSTKKVFDAILRSKTVKRIIITSSTAAVVGGLSRREMDDHFRNMQEKERMRKMVEACRKDEEDSKRSLEEKEKVLKEILKRGSGSGSGPGTGESGTQDSGMNEKLKLDQCNNLKPDSVDLDASRASTVATLTPSPKASDEPIGMTLESNSNTVSKDSTGASDDHDSIDPSTVANVDDSDTEEESNDNHSTDTSQQIINTEEFIIRSTDWTDTDFCKMPCFIAKTMCEKLAWTYHDKPLVNNINNIHNNNYYNNDQKPVTQTLQVVSLCPGSVFGPILLEKPSLNSEEIKRLAAANLIPDIGILVTHVEDLARANATALTGRGDGKRLLVCCEKPVRSLEAVEALKCGLKEGSDGSNIKDSYSASLNTDSMKNTVIREISEPKTSETETEEDNSEKDVKSKPESTDQSTDNTVQISDGSGDNNNNDIESDNSDPSKKSRFGSLGLRKRFTSFKSNLNEFSTKAKDVSSTTKTNIIAVKDTTFNVTNNYVIPPIMIILVFFKTIFFSIYGIEFSEIREEYLQYPEILTFRGQWSVIKSIPSAIKQVPTVVKSVPTKCKETYTSVKDATCTALDTTRSGYMIVKTTVTEEIPNMIKSGYNRGKEVPCKVKDIGINILDTTTNGMSRMASLTLSDIKEAILLPIYLTLSFLALILVSFFDGVFLTITTISDAITNFSNRVTIRCKARYARLRSTVIYLSQPFKDLLNYLYNYLIQMSEATYVLPYFVAKTFSMLHFGELWKFCEVWYRAEKIMRADCAELKECLGVDCSDENGVRGEEAIKAMGKSMREKKMI